jgi:hypothetical protein
MKLRILILLILCVSLSSCPENHNIGVFPSKPVNMIDINSEFDDYNSLSPEYGGTSPLCFSSNRNSYGHDFDLIYVLLDVFVERKTGKLEIQEDYNPGSYDYDTNLNLRDAISKVYSPYDELGPYLIHLNDDNPMGTGYQSFPKSILLYANNESGNFDIKFTENVTDDTFSTPSQITFLNSEADDLYPTLNSDRTSIYFCSDRSGNFDIYETTFANTNDILSVLTAQTAGPILKDTILSSESNDKCPFIVEDLMVFCSDRPGGFGGYDLYYSTLVNNKWSAPVNFGKTINTQYDEYRPIVRTYNYEFANNMMIFSSNRPGGKGGFDLYYVGIKRY